jgi:hypothetical protein
VKRSSTHLHNHTPTYPHTYTHAYAHTRTHTGGTIDAADATRTGGQYEHGRNA